MTLLRVATPSPPPSDHAPNNPKARTAPTIPDKSFFIAKSPDYILSQNI